MPTVRRAPWPAPAAATPDLSPSALACCGSSASSSTASSCIFRSVETKAGVSGVQLWALSVIGDVPGIGVSRLARTMDIHQSTASNLLRPLLAQGLVLSDRVATDKRAVHLSLSGCRGPHPEEGARPRPACCRRR